VYRLCFQNQQTCRKIALKFQYVSNFSSWLLFERIFVSINISNFSPKMQPEFKHLFSMKYPLLSTSKQTLKKLKFLQTSQYKNLIKIRFVFTSFLQGNRKGWIWRIETRHIIKLVLQTRSKLQRCCIGSTISPSYPPRSLNSFGFRETFGSQTG